MTWRAVATSALLLHAACAPAASPLPSPSAPRVQPRDGADVPPDTRCSHGAAAVEQIGAVSLRGSRLGEACAALRSRAGGPLDAATVEADVVALYRTGHFADVTAVVEETDGASPALVFEVKERPAVASVSLRAPEGIDVRAALGPKPARHDPAWVHAARARLRAALREEGYRKAEVAHDVAPSADGVSISFVVVPGARTVLGAVRFEGLARTSADVLGSDLSLRPGEPAPEALVEHDALVVQAALYDLGLLESEVRSRVEENFLASRIDVVFAVTEGPVYRLGEVRVTGADLLPSARYDAHLHTLPRGSVFVRSKVAAVIQAVEGLHQGEGAARHVDVRTKLDPKRHVADLELHVE